MKAAAADLYLAMSGIGRITLRDSAKFLDQLRITVRRTEYQNRLSLSQAS